MRQKDIEKCYKFVLYVSNSKELASRVTLLLCDRYELLDADLSDQLIYRDCWSFIQSFVHQEEVQDASARATGYLFYQRAMSIEEISETLQFGRSSTVTLLNMERERVGQLLSSLSLKKNSSLEEQRYGV